jgi:glycosyltransferase involved in cell wall biosynthesis
MTTAVRNAGTAASLRVMVIATNFPPDGAVGTMRTLRLVRHLASEGWCVDVVTVSPDRFRPGTVSDPALLDKVPAAVEVMRPRPWRPIERCAAALRGRGGSPAAPAAARPTRPAARRQSWTVGALRAALAVPDREVSWIAPAVRAAWRRAREYRPDIIYSSGPPFSAHLVGHVVSMLSRRPWVADFRDPWARAPWREDRFAFEKQAWRMLERRVIARADAAVFVTDTNRSDFAQYYGREIASRFHLVPNGCDVTDFAGLVRAERDHRFVLLHAGSLYGARDPRPLLKGLHAAIHSGAIQHDQILLRFIGRVGVPGLDDAVRELRLENVVEFVSQMPRRAVLQEMMNASALLIVQPVTTVSVPAKLYEYMAAGRPVLALAEPGGETARVVTRSGAGVVVPSHDEDAIARALVSLARSRDAGPPHVNPAEYDGELRARQLAHLLFDVVAGRTANGAPRATARAIATADERTPSEVTRS